MCQAQMCCDVLCCAVLCCDVLCCAVWYAVLCASAALLCMPVTALQVLFVLFALVKCVAGAYFLALLFHEARKLRTHSLSPAERLQRSVVFTRKVCSGLLLQWSLELVLCVVEHLDGPQGLVLVDGVDVLRSGRTFWKKNNVWISGNELASFHCTRRNFHTFEVSAYLVWSIAVVIMYFHRRFSDQKKRAGQALHKKQMARMFKFLKKPALERRSQPSRPPNRDASDEEWVQWIRESQVPMNALLQVLGQEDGSRAAVKMARTGIYGGCTEEDEEWADATEVLFDELGTKLKLNRSRSR
eukprot:TRINITY_DN11601_c0_g1_i1.p1 TRINITY_DN11601_c0_g1~~TRINITY_DN11601_c0_g1_i1.p1  ORF type:complete len:299 (-),score=89.57 TRINITY_DN11601_c0_g1_i1:320-1216(-)